MDFNLINLLWSVLAVPIGWFYISYTKRGARIAQLENDVGNLKDKIDPISKDIRALTETLTEARVAMEQRLYSIATDQIKNNK